MALTYIRPDADTTDGNWVNASGNNTNLYDSVNESVASDSDYIRSGNNPVNDIVKLRLGNFGSVPDEPMTVRYRFKKVVSAGEVLSLKVRLVEGNAPGDTIAEWEHDGVSDTYTDGEQELTSGQFALISDFDDLYLEFEAISGALVVIPPSPFDATYLLTDETEGYAINAMYPGDPTYAGENVGGSVAVIDSGTPANDLDDVPLDSSNLTQTGTSAKMAHWHEAPYVRWTPHNLLLRSQEFGTIWVPVTASVSANSTTAPDGTTTADTLVEGGFGTNHIAYQDVGSASTTYTFSAYLKAKERTAAALILENGTNYATVVADLSNGIISATASGGTGTLVGSSITGVGNGWYRVTLTGSIGASPYWSVSLSNSTTPSLTASGEPSYSGDTTSGIYVWGAQVNRGSIATPYLVTTSAARIGIPQSYDINEDMFGILVEPAATNLCVYSEAISTSPWQATGSATISANATTAPDGTVTADEIVAAASLESGFRQGATVTNGVAYTVSVYAKQGVEDWAFFSFSDVTANAAGAYFDLANGVTGSNVNVGSLSVLSKTITPVGNGWYRLSVTVNSASTAMYLCLFVAESDGDVTAGSGDSIYAWGAQLELGTVATSYIPTLGSTVTRATDKIGGLLTTLPFTTSPTAVSMYSDFYMSVTSTEHPVFFGNNSNDEISVFGASSNWNWYVNSAGPTQAQINLGAQGAPARAQVSGRAKANDFAGSLNGAAVSTDTSGTMPDWTTPVVSLEFMGDGFGTDGGGSQSLMLYRIVLVPRAVIDADLPDWRYNY